ncbi:hypothetical protein AK812_SmicGene19471 [Symbiodinium microadriaticum]|uniref:Uncharacterized protein n=1 Tax=Symbiodinium microadriaticum TaxID=2951 RepID=A0A1Q9DSG5_SYMMI|nr:hypothetical protein AK812_SmicGene19471 [Symbiodinium microadriaticum]
MCNSATHLESARPMQSGCYTGGGGSLLPPQLKDIQVAGDDARADSTVQGHPWPLDASEPCERCGRRCLAFLPLQGSLMEHIWGCEACVVCLRCGFARPDNGETRAQRCIARVLRVESCVCCVGMVKEAASVRPTRSQSRVASVSFGLADTTLAAAATVMTRTEDLDIRERRSRPFAHDLTWITSSLADTGLDLFYNKVRNLSVDVTVEEIDDVRMLRLRKEVSPVILWLELAYVLSPQFDLITWNGALAKIFGAIKLPAAVLMRMNINRLRHMAGAGKLQDSDRAEATTPLMWPLALHRVLVAPKESSQETLAIAMRGGGWYGLRMGLEFDEGKQDVGKVSVAAIMTILSKTRSFFGAASTRALMQARRILRRKQVFIYLRGLHGSIVLGDKEDNTKTRYGEAGEEAESEATEESQSEPDDELQVLGHFREYVYFSQMALMSIQVLGVMVRSAIRLHSKANTSVTAREGGSKMSATPIEQVMLRHGFVESAMRALLRHAAIPEIAREVLLLLKYLVQDDMGHNESVTAQIQLLTPAERPMTLILAMARLSQRQDRSNLLLCLEVYVSLGPHSFEAASSPLPSQPPSPRAAQAKPASRRSSKSRRSSGIVPSLRLPVQLKLKLASHYQDDLNHSMEVAKVQESSHSSTVKRLPQHSQHTISGSGKSGILISGGGHGAARAALATVPTGVRGLGLTVSTRKELDDDELGDRALTFSLPSGIGSIGIFFTCTGLLESLDSSATPALALAALASSPSASALILVALALALVGIFFINTPAAFLLGSASLFFPSSFGSQQLVRVLQEAQEAAVANLAHVIASSSKGSEIFHVFHSSHNEQGDADPTWFKSRYDCLPNLKLMLPI